MKSPNQLRQIILYTFALLLATPPIFACPSSFAQQLLCIFFQIIENNT